ncbi:NADH-quinone oxidoreductase subunit N [Aureibacter tunicatorum]|uniref:NADH-quinone oxidoreductase subunit N n=1 Tax=Aureibacter tunicatorum TaxID=866807 RepID=A0AAE3XM78_9BACT|nr:NADH-quinone oxidoreductase subunit N [Aureibacter tunicatorum]MDR6239060.1 NADH-quinone oxidoreductase subunit N [Aureibacter tunicatorum]BDD05014.1 NADH-quinone oxidoreductase subunit N [Aureibacter tunicatorum]
MESKLVGQLSIFDKLNDIIDSFGYITSELLLIAAIILVTIVVILPISKGLKELIYIGISALTTLMALAVNINLLEVVSGQGGQLIFNRMMSVDSFGLIWTIVIMLGTLLFIVMNKSYLLKSSKTGEYYVLILGMLLGAVIGVKSNNLLLLFIAIEFVSLCAYAITNLGHSAKSAEASLKYLLFGAVCGAVMLYGFSLLYGINHELNLYAIDFGKPAVWAVFGVSCIAAVGVLFKVSAVPFHIWVGDVYESAPTPSVAFFSTVPKFMGIAILFRMLEAMTNSFELLDAVEIWRATLVVIASVTMTLGNILAINQQSVKRMLGYSSVAQSGMFLAGLVCFSTLGMKAVLFYAIVYAFMNFAAFYLVQVVENKFGDDRIESFAGLGHKAPFIGVVIVVVMISLTGLPPTAGFTGKLMIFSALWEASQTIQDPWLIGMIIVALVNTVVSLFYYLKVPYFMYFKDNEKEPFKDFTLNALDCIVLIIFTLPLLILFFKPEIVYSFCGYVNTIISH